MSTEGMITPLQRTLGAIQPLEPMSARTQPTAIDGPNFAELLKDQMNQLIDLQNSAEQAQQDFLTGKTEDLTGVVLAVQQADIALNFAIELRNKIIESYMEISRMQI